MNTQAQPYIKAVAGDRYHQLIAIYYFKQDVKPSEAVDTLKMSNYFVRMGGELVKLQASSVASILTGITIASPAKSKKLTPVNNGTDSTVPEIPTEA